MDINRELTDRLKSEALRLGFNQVGIAPAVQPPGLSRYENWLELGHAAGMEYLRRQALARSHPNAVLDGVRSVIVVSMVYGRRVIHANTDDPKRGKIARYAQGGDYHDVIWRRLEQLLDWLKGEVPAVRGRATSDTAPILERDFAQLAGLGWIGKNTMLIDRRVGSFNVLGALLVDIEMAYDTRHDSAHCGTCTRCLDECPTDAFTGPYQLDARRCLSYWTIEHRGPIAEDELLDFEGWAFGCDVCQDVCPWNRKAPDGTEPALQPKPEWTNPDLIAWLNADPKEFQTILKGTALRRAKRAGLLRNAALILGQRRVAEAVPALIRMLEDLDPAISSASAWALREIATPEALEALRGVAV